MATAPRKQVSCRLAALALVCLAQATLGSRPAAAQPPSLSCIHTTAVAAYAASVSQSAPAMRALQRAQPSAAHEQHPAPPEPAKPAQPPAEPTPRTSAEESQRTPATAPATAKSDETKSARATTRKATHAPVEPKQLPPLPSMLERLGGDHAKRAMQVAQGMPAGRVALRPMFWMTRDQRGGMVALGGRF